MPGTTTTKTGLVRLLSTTKTIFVVASILLFCSLGTASLTKTTGTTPSSVVSAFVLVQHHPHSQVVDRRSNSCQFSRITSNSDMLPAATATATKFLCLTRNSPKQVVFGRRLDRHRLFLSPITPSIQGAKAGATKSFSSRSSSFRSTTSTPSSPFIGGRSVPIISRTSTVTTTQLFMSSSKPGVATLEELTTFVEDAGSDLVVVDVRNPDASVEPGDQKSLAVAELPGGGGVDGNRPKALHLIWDRSTKSMPLPPDSVPKDAPIITHCGGGGRGQLAKEYLESNGYTRVINGAGPKETELWKLYGDK